MGDAGSDEARRRSGARVACALALFAFVRVALTICVVPPFGNVDEALHWNTVCAYASGELPEHGRQALREANKAEEVLYASPEFVDARPAVHSMRAPVELRELHLRARLAEREGWVNCMAWEPPLYYALAAVWMRAGELLGVEGIDRVYWTRGLGALVLALLVLLGGRFVRDFAPDRRALALAFPLLLAVWPMDAFYTIGNDALVALFAFLGFDLCMRARRRGELPPGPGLVALALVWAAVPLCKPTSVPMLLVPLVLLGPLFWRARGQGALFAALVAAPSLAFMAWSQHTTGEWAYWVHKMRFHGFEPRPIAAIAEHAGWSLAGIASFFEGIGTTLWRGELAWHGEVMKLGLVDALCLVLTPIALLASAAALGWRAPLSPRVRSTALLAIGASLAFLLFSSLTLDFPDRPANQPPSQADPFFRVGRLMLGALPLLLLLVSDGLLRLGGKRLAIAFAAVLLASEVIVTSPLLGSEFHAFSLPR